MTLRLALKHFRDDARGSVAIIAAASLLLGIAATAVGVDLSMFHYQKRKQQSATDIAALAASANLDRASAAVGENARLNGFSQRDVAAVEVGVYSADAGKSVDARFTPGAANPNAVRVTMVSHPTMLFGRALAAWQGGSEERYAGEKTKTGAAAPDRVTLRTTSIDARSPSASFAIGSRLAALDGGLANSVLSSLVGAKVSLSVMDYDALVKANVDLFKFAQALSTRLSLKALTYGEVVSTQVRAGDALNAMVEVLRSESPASARAADALGKLVTALPTSRTIDLSKLIDFGPFGKATLASGTPLPVELSGYDLITALLQQSAGAHLLNTSIGVAIPGLAGAELKLSLGERPVGTSFVTVGQTGASVHTAQTRLLLKVRLGGGALPADVQLPVYVEVASATAKLTELKCDRQAVSSARIGLGVKPGVVDAWIGQVSDGAMTNYVSSPRPDAATLLSAPAVAVTGRAHATVANLADATISFTHADVLARTRKQISTTNFTASLISGLVNDLVLRVTVLGLGLPLPGIGPLVAQTIGAAATPIDGLLNGVLTTLGLRLGQADTWVMGVRCGTPSLVR
ncbi:MAG: hypothetical protein JWL93_1527 [Hyphomicrobiales bacterium]|nr:hypothetical protein [Hyphomicrobiales bacterium]